MKKTTALIFYTLFLTGILMFPPSIKGQIDGGALLKNFGKKKLDAVKKKIKLKIKKRKRKNTLFNRSYHNLTSKYNAYWNARETMRIVDKKLKKEFKYDFTDILPTFIIPKKKTASAFFPEMDKVIKKCAKVISKHSIFVKGVEHCKWIDKSYNLMAKAHLYKHEYSESEEFFSYVRKTFRKKPSKDFADIKSMQQALIEENLTLAKKISQKTKPEKVNDKHLSSYHATIAAIQIKEKDYEPAIKSLKKAAQLKKVKKLNKAIYFYIIAQINEKINQPNQAKIYFELAKKYSRNRNYTLLFNASINSYINEAKANNESKDFLIQKLKKLEVDKKNKEFLNQIYQAMGSIYLSIGDINQAIVYFKKSLSAENKNKIFKAITHFKLAEIYYKRKEYLSASKNFSACSDLLPPTHPFFPKAKKLKTTLSILVNNLTTLNEQDSLLKLINNKDYRKKAIQKKIDDYQKKLDKKNRSKNDNPLSSQDIPSDFNDANSDQNKNWYFYNPTSIFLGISKFKSIWGSIPLNDNWRRSTNKIKNLDSSNDKEDKSSEEKNIDEKLTEEYYEKSIPKNPEEISQIHKKIISSLYILGDLYTKSFKNDFAAIKSYKRILNEYDTTSLKPDIYFKLYNIYSLKNDTENEKKYKNLLIKNFPYSDYTKLILDPNYNNIKINNKKIIENYYMRIFELYKNKEYKKALFRSQKSASLYPDNNIQDRFDYIGILSKGQTHKNIVYDLKNFIKKHPSSKLKPTAQNLLKKAEKKEKNTTKLSGELDYNTNDKTHLFFHVVVLPRNSKKINDLKNKLSDFNTKFFNLSKLNISVVIINDKDQIILTKSFLSEEKAHAYYTAFNLQNPIKKMLYNYQFYMTQNNFLTLYQKKEPNIYFNFFKKNYLKN